MSSEPLRSLNVLISGAGIAGPATAFWLSRLGHKCTIVERFPGIRENGLQIDVRKEGVEAMRRMGLLDEVKKHVVDELGTKFVDSKGRCVALFPKIEEDKHGKQGFTSEYEIMRHDLVKVLVDASKDNVTYRFNLSVSEFDNREDSVVVTFSDGTVETYDMLIGADGHGSRIRKMLQKSEGEGTDQSVNMGVYMCFFKTPPTPNMEKMTNFYIATQQRVLATRLHSEGQVYMSVRGPPDELESVLTKDVGTQKQYFEKVFRDAGWRAEELIEAMHKTDDFYATSTHVIRSSVWSKNRVVLVGDAGYSPTPLTGTGTSLALIGATILAGEVARHGTDDLPGAFAAYERTLRPYVDIVQDIPRSVTHGPFCEGKAKLRFVQLLLCTMTKLRLDKLFQSFILRSNDPFRIPQYPELDKLIGSQA
ncbi:FAD dependent oxidoreductase [Cordyceps fumosorosea ARSEF 2679]|uniref:FAD dependent oxidoreductase n=1 Tax=Cordyceps fumosorosea (strain ARSEF 2679) TaxID=1081104 RepID=A0A167SZR2_CORFA|nr:FAD dependent oxidoreductase [Cordyceps fumosorosea ARSEF 2679]OAA60098.1 FAD dependent oxidoreductase [Cordyceps fumosorosea ARSEF 2679]